MTNITPEAAGMPPAIATAIVAVKMQVRQLGVDEDNRFAGYKYVSVDKFYATVGPMMSAAGLALLIDETSSAIEVSESTEKDGRVKKTPWLFVQYALSFMHESGAVSAPMRRSLAMPMTGPQTYGAAQSYVEKQFLRQVFKVPTGEKDADEAAESEDAPSRGRAVPRSANGTRRPATDLDAFAAEPLEPDYDGQGRMVAAKGTAALRIWWQSLGGPLQRQLKDHLPEYKALADAADKAIATAEPFDLAPPPERDPAFWAGATLGLGPAADGREFRAMMHHRLREARTAREVEALRADNPQIDQLPRTDKDEVLGMLMDRELELRAAEASA